MEEEKYCYCQVKPHKIDHIYSYISDEKIEPFTYVEIPFGIDNAIWQGEVLEVGYYSREDAPYPVEKTKHILRKISYEEYCRRTEKSSSRKPSEEELLELSKANRYLLTNDSDAALEWACRHHDCAESVQIMDMVVKCYELALEQGNSRAALNLGTLYYTGRGVSQDFKRAAKLYELAAQKGEIRALCNLGYCYYYGRHQEIDYEKAYYYFNLGAILANDANCLYKLGDMFMEGRYVEPNTVYGEVLYRRAFELIESDEASEADKELIADIYLRIGRMLLESEHLQQNPKLALNFLLSALMKFYERRKTDPFADGLIAKTKTLIAEAEKRLLAE